MRPRRLAALTVVPLALAVVPVHAAAPAVPAAAVAPAAAAAAVAPTVAVDRAPTTIAGSRTRIGAARDVETDTAGRVYVLTPTAVRVFAPGTAGNKAPTRSVAVAPPTGLSTSRLAVDATGWLYVLLAADDQTGFELAVYEPDGTAAGTYSDADLGLDLPSDLTGVGSQVAIADYGDSDVKVYDLHDADPTLVRHLDPGTTGPTRIDLPSAIDSDRSGRIVLSGSNWVSVFAAGADSTEDPATAPRQFVQGTRTGLGPGSGRFTSGVGLDGRGRILVISGELYEIDDTTFGSRNPRVLAFATGATGDAVPQAVLRGARTGLGEVSGLEVAPSGALVTHRYDRSAGAWSAAVSVHRPLGPYAAPATPRRLTITGTGARRTVSWKAAATNADTPVRAYVVVYTCDHGQTSSGFSASVKAGRRSYVLRTGGPGRCTVAVSARNVIGTGKPARLAFPVKR